MGEFICRDRRLELHVRGNLGLVRYHVGPHNASHETYMRELGALSKCMYPGFGDNVLASFEALEHDLQMAEDFLAGSAAVLRKAAEVEAAQNEALSKKLMYGDAREHATLEKIRKCFQDRDYNGVGILANELTFPARAPVAYQRMIEFAPRRIKQSHVDK